MIDTLNQTAFNEYGLGCIRRVGGLAGRAFHNFAFPQALSFDYYHIFAPEHCVAPVGPPGSNLSHRTTIASWWNDIVTFRSEGVCCRDVSDE